MSRGPTLLSEEVDIVSTTPYLKAEQDHSGKCSKVWMISPSKSGVDKKPLFEPGRIGQLKGSSELLDAH